MNSSGESSASTSVNAIPVAPSTTLASGLSKPSVITVDHTNVYWGENYIYDPNTSDYDSAIKKVSLASGMITTLASLSYVDEITSIAVDSDSVYWTVYRGYGVSKIGINTTSTTPTSVASATAWVETVAVDTTNIYWATGSSSWGYIWKVSKGGGTAKSLVSEGVNNPTAIVVDDTDVYWIDGGNSIKKVSKNGATTPTALAWGVDPRAITVDANNVYWTEEGTLSVANGYSAGTAGTVKKVSKNSGTVTTLATDLTRPYAIVGDDTNIYWTEKGVCDVSSSSYCSYGKDGTLKTIGINATSGTLPIIIASGLSYPVGIAIDATSVYWTEYNGGTVKKIAKTPTGTTPSVPTGVSVSAGNGYVKISWNFTNSATSYNIYWLTTSGVTKTTGTNITGATSPYTHTGRTNGTTYYYVVTAVNSYGESAESSQVSVTLPITVNDIDGNVYNTVTIGTQVWMKENLNVTKYRNGDTIPTIKADISSETSPKYQWANKNNDDNATTYGRLYTYYAATDSRGLCPTGWHLPTDSEWTTLIDYLGGESVAGGKMKEAGTTHWSSPNEYASNSSGFTALPGGYRYSYGVSYFSDIGDSGSWWSSTEKNDTDAWYRYLHYYLNDVFRYSGDKKYGYSVRCVKD